MRESDTAAPPPVKASDKGLATFESVPLGRYTMLTIPGSALWCFAFAGIGWALGASYESFHHAFDFVDVVIVAGAVALALYLVARRRSN